MRKKILFIILALAAITGGLYARQIFLERNYGLKVVAKETGKIADYLKDGDIIFQTSHYGQSLAVQLVTHSPYSHCGIIYKEGDICYVAEAVQPVKKTPLNKWIARGDDGHFVIKRLKNADKVLTAETLAKMKEVGNNFMGKNYDIYFNWSDENIYCSELVWKIYKRGADIEIGKLEKLRDFDLTNDIVQEIVKERYGNNIPLDETVISPVSILNSDLLVTVKSN